MSAELVVNARHLSGDGPLWMLYEAAARGPGERLRLIVSDEPTARAVLRALDGCGVASSLDPIGEEYHVLCHADQTARDALRRWLDRPAGAR
ncbi:MAG: hypothetical protein ACYDIE_04140 [Candidatus Krumholzibacteriia bacterium]